MSCNSVIYTVMGTPASVLAGGAVPLGSAVRKYGCGIDLDGNALQLTAPGYYDVDVNLTVQPVAAGAITATVYVDGAPYAGAVGTGTAAAAGDDVQIVIPTLVRVNCNVRRTVTVVLSAAATVTNAAVVAEKV